MFDNVSHRAKSFRQPRGGLIRRNQFSIYELKDNKTLWGDENIHPTIVGIAIDYLVRFLQGTRPEEAFKISLLGAQIIKKVQPEEDISEQLLQSLKGNDPESIVCACKLAGYDVCFRKGVAFYKSVKDINPNDRTIWNIQVMAERSLSFWKQYGPIVKDGFTFEGGYTLIIGKGDGDYLTKDTLWDFKVSREEPRSWHRLQLLIYYLMGKHSIHREFDTITKIGIFNPRKNKIYICNLNEISQDILNYVSYHVIGYGWNKEDCYNYFNDEFKNVSSELHDFYKEMIDDYCKENNLL